MYTVSTSVEIYTYIHSLATANSQKDETRNGRRNTNRNPEWWEDFSQLQIQVKSKSQFEFVPRDTEKFHFLDFV